MASSPNKRKFTDERFARDAIGAGTVDVVVTDGFTGNIALKTAEGTAKMFGTFLKDSLMSSLTSRVGDFFHVRLMGRKLCIIFFDILVKGIGD